MYKPKWKRLWKWLFKTMDPAMDRVDEDLALEQAVKEVAQRFGLSYVPQQPLVGVKADIIIERQGLPLCGISGQSKTGIPKGVLARAIQTHICQLTDVSWDYQLN